MDPHIRLSRELQLALPPEIEMLGVIPHFNSPLGDRLLKKDMLIILGTTIIFMAVYLVMAFYWQIVKA
jgi:hypothetical protein